MQIFLRRAIEPGSPEAGSSPVVLARNDTSDRLQRLLKRYAMGHVNGRSFLISGHRGAGKTTLVQKVVHDVGNELNRSGLRPLLVILPGPSLLPPEGSMPVPASEETQAVLAQITLNLYRTLARHFADRFARFVESTGFPSLWLEVHGRPMLPAELASAFRLALDGPIELAELRAFWSEVRALGRGILFDAPAREDQGTREIAALWGCLRAYLSLAAADFQEKADSALSAKSTSEASLKTERDKGLLSAIIGIGGGSTVGAGLAHLTHDPLLATFAGLATAIVGGLLFNYSSMRSHESSAGFSSTLTLKRDMQSLARELPELIQRCRDCGIAPVFLVDELDKVERLEDRMGSLIRNAKFFVTEQAVFFFVTDRSYFEFLENKTRAEAYPREHTFFSERLFVSYSPADWLRYLRELLICGRTDEQEKRSELAAIDRLAYVLLCRSRMHAIDLRRQISGIADTAGFAWRDDIEFGVRSDTLTLLDRLGPALEAYMQVAVEVTLADDPDLLNRCYQEPRFLQVVYDALYYLAHQWRTQPELSFLLEERQFSEFLKKRSEGLWSNSDTDLGYLFLKVKDMLFWMQNPDKLATAAARCDIPVTVRPIVENAPPLLYRTDDERYAWAYDAHGRKLNPSTVEVIRDNIELNSDIAMIRALSEAVKSNTNDKIGLGAIQKANLLSPTPRVEDVFEAMTRLSNLQANPLAYELMDEDAHNVSRFATEVRGRSHILARAIVAAWLLSRSSARSEESDRFLAAWGTLVDHLSHPQVTVDSTAEFAKGLFYTFQTRTAGEPLLSTPGFQQYRYELWSQSLKAAVTRIKGMPPDSQDWTEIEKRAWDGWAQKSIAFLRGTSHVYGKIDDNTMNELLCAVREISPGRLLANDLGMTPIMSWSHIALTYAKLVPRRWQVYVALIATGFEDTAEILLSNTLDDNPYLPPELDRAIRARISSKRTPAPKVVLVCLSSGSIAANWRPDPAWSCFALTAATIDQIPQLRTADYVLIETERKLADEVSASEIDRVTRALQNHEVYGPNKTRVGILAPHTVTGPREFPVIVAPPDLSNAMSRLSGKTSAT